MKTRSRIVSLFIPIGGLLLTGFLFQPNRQEEASLRQALNDYLFEGLKSSDTELLDQIIHPDWRLLNVPEGRLVQFERSDFYSWLSGEEDSETTYEILSVDISGPIASVKTRENASDHYWIDYLHVAKIDGRWWIIGKLAHPFREGAPQ